MAARILIGFCGLYLLALVHAEDGNGACMVGSGENCSVAGWSVLQKKSHGKRSKHSMMEVEGLTDKGSAFIGTVSGATVIIHKESKAARGSADHALVKGAVQC